MRLKKFEASDSHRQKRRRIGPHRIVPLLAQRKICEQLKSAVQVRRMQ
jgi:hypothetical protein